jgi:molybdopterin-guanine dinucleotide biosynthesis protein A
MATKKERVVFYVDQKIKEKLNEFAELENRSLSNWLESLALNEIKVRKKTGNENNQKPINFNQPIIH